MKEIAIIGMSSYFPGAKTYQDFWNNLVEGKNHVREIEPDRWDTHSYYSPSVTNENKSVSKWGAFLENMRGFDNDFFGILPDEARSMDPQTRLLLQETWHCIEDASIHLKDLQQSTVSVYTAIFSLDHLQHMARRDSIDLYACLGSYPCMAANRISHFLKFSGASFSLDAACASSLTALHEAKLALRSGSCDYAIVGAANTISHPWHNISMSKARLLSPDGLCKTFDKSANGYVRSEGVAALLLTNKKNALKKNHRIHAILKGTAVNHCAGGRGITTPSFEAQQKVIHLSLQDAKIKAGEINFIETHGTGTALGDAIEFNALSEVFSAKKKKKIPIGSVKTNIGHLEAAAGLAGVIKSVLMLKYNQIPPHLHLRESNPLIDLVKGPFCLHQELVPWPAKKKARLIGVSSMGFGGVNSHVIIQEFIPTKRNSSTGQKAPVPLVFILSAATLKSLQLMTERWIRFFSTSSLSVENLSFVCAKMLRCASSFKFRTATLMRENSEAPFTLPPHQLSSKSGKRPEIAIAIIDLINPKELPTLEPFYPWLFKKEQMRQIANLSEKGRSFLATYLLGSIFLKMGITPKIIAGQGDAQIVAKLLAGAINWETAIEGIEKNQTHVLRKPPLFPVWENDSVLYPCVISEKKCEKVRQKLLSSDRLEADLFKKISTLIENQLTIKQYLDSLHPLFQKHQLDLTEILSQKKSKWNSKEVAIVHISFLVSLFQLNKKYKTDFPISSKCPYLLFIARLISDGVLSLDSLIESIDSPLRFFQLLDSHLKSSTPLIPHLLPILEQKKEIKTPLAPSKAIDLSKEPFQNCSMIYLGNQSGDSVSVNNLEQAIQLLIHFWLEGREIAWGKYAEMLSHPGNLEQDIPQYEFDLKIF